jgi:hypothetical protein
MRETQPVPWVETESLSFVARHDSDQADAVAAVLDDLEEFRLELAELFGTTPGEVSVVLHPRALMLGLAHPWLPLARRMAAPAARRYFAGWFTGDEIHVLDPAALERRASGVEGSHEALRLAPRHEYAHLVIGANNPLLPPPFTPGTFRRYLRLAWLAEGAAAHFAGQVQHLRAAIALRLREGSRPEFPPSTRDAVLLGGTLFELLEREAGEGACVELATLDRELPPRAAIERAFDRPAAAVERHWRAYLSALTAA